MDPSLFRYIWQNSRREQIAILLLILGSLPFYWLSLEVPKRIVNEALQGEAFRDGNVTAKLFAMSFDLPEFLGGGTVNIYDGNDFNQIDYLLALSFLFLGFVLINGAFKYKINIDKGVLAERILRRMRFDLFSRMMRFRPEDIRQVKPAEAASMINNEVEPIGAFSGDAFVWPVFLASQALTALIFILTQSFWLGIVALSIVLVQAFVIPILRRRQLELARQRQIAARQLSGRIGEMVDSAPLIHNHGANAYTEAEIGSRLGRLFGIRVALYKRKYAVKYLNTLLSQITPFFFYAIGGYFALTGSLDIGQLVAVIAAYKDLPPPVKELIDWDQRRADITIKYQQVITQFANEELVPTSISEEQVEALKSNQPIRVDGLRVVDQRGTPQLETLNLIIERPAHVAIVGSAGSARDILARALGRQLTDYEGRVSVSGMDLTKLSDNEASSFMAYASAEPILLPGSIEENMVFGLNRLQPDQTEWKSSETPDLPSSWLAEARRSGNPQVPFEVDWIDYSGTGASDRKSLRPRIIEVLCNVGLDDDLYNFGLQGKLPEDTSPHTMEQIIAARNSIRKRIVDENLSKIVEPFDPDHFNTNSPLGGNLVFGVAKGQKLRDRALAADPYLRSILAAEALDRPLAEIGSKIITTTLETFADLPSGHPLFERYEMIQPSEMETYEKLHEKTESKDAGLKLSQTDINTLISLALQYIENRHRLGLVDAALEQRILRARKSFMQFLPQAYASEIEFYDPDNVMMAAPIRDNLLFGRVAFGVANASQKVSELLRSTLVEFDLLETIYELGIEYDVGPGGVHLFAPQRAAIGLGRCLLCQPNVLISEGGFSAFTGADAQTVLANIQKAMSGETLIMTLSDEALAKDFDRVVKFDGVRGKDMGSPEGAAGGTDEQDSDTSGTNSSPVPAK